MSTPVEWAEWLRVDPEIRRATTPSGRIYHDDAFFRAAAERILARGWHLAGDLDRVRVPGAVLPRTLLPGALDECIVFTRDAGDELHCLSNVCTHRGSTVVQGEGVLQSLRCRYHGRRFALDGRFQSMPEFEDAQGFPRPEDDLPRVPWGSLGRLLFASVSPREPFERQVEPVLERVGWMPLDDFRLDPSRSRDYLVEANWALYCENYLEGFHIPYVHVGLAAELDYGSYETVLFDGGSVQIAYADGGEAVLPLPAGSPDHGRDVAAYYFFLFPSTMLNFYPWGLSVNAVRPLSPTRTRVSFRSYVWKPELLDRGAGAELDRVEREDEEVVEAVQVAVGSRLYPRGRYSPRRETGVHQFHRELGRWLAEG
ncbi:MAG: SRPBCC family protein [Thermoanaerobaculia bacterium]|nr:SRPBCC family protein [Thermoanaerobaculia bacterium]